MNAALGLMLALLLNAPAAQTKALVDGNTAFALDLYAHLKTGPDNLFFSPYSISTCLGMAYAGARRNTENQMATVLRFSKDQGLVHAGFGELQRQLATTGQQKGIELNVANALWSQKGDPFLPAFLNSAKDQYQANLSQADFKTGADEARRAINLWVAQKTRDKIKDILPQGSVTPMTRLVLANAIYFKSVWAVTFPKTATFNAPFHTTSSRSVQVPLMSHLDSVNYMEDNDLQAVELPYAGGGLSMVIMLPRQINGCGQLESGLTPTFLSHALGQMKKEKVEILIPRFKLESDLSLAQELSKMGMTDAFCDKADFSGIDGARDLYISAVFHKAWVEVNEEGTEAAAATAVTMMTKSIRQGPPPPPVFRADHPFIFLIRDTRSGSLLFLGRLSNPTTTANN